MDDENRRAEYTEPRCISEGEALRSRFVADIERINSQLGEPNKLDPKTGERMGGKEYCTWRKNALCALNARRIIVTRLNEWLLAARRRAAVEAKHGPVVAASYTTVDAAYRLFMTLAKDDVEFEPHEWEVVESLRTYLESAHAQAA